MIRVSNFRGLLPVCGTGSSTTQGHIKTEQCERCGEGYPATYMPSPFEAGRASKITTRYCSMKCKNDAKRDRDRAARETRKLKNDPK
jgi:hypothetical protein